MPQLMPLMWVNSTFMLLFIIFMLVDMYFYNTYMFMNKMGDYNNLMTIKYSW